MEIGHTGPPPKKSIIEDFKIGKGKHELKEIENTFLILAMHVLYPYRGIFSPLPPPDKNTITHC